MSVLYQSTLLGKGLWTQEMWKGEKNGDLPQLNTSELICESVIDIAGNRESANKEYKNETKIKNRKECQDMLFESHK